MELARKQAGLFNTDNAAYCNILVNASCSRHILVIAYHHLVYQNKIVPIEDLLQADKEQAWATAKDMADGRLNKINLILLVKALMALEYFLNEN